MQRTAFFMHANPDSDLEALTRPRNEWIDATAERHENGNPIGVETQIGRVNLATAANDHYDTINGTVWLESRTTRG